MFKEFGEEERSDMDGLLERGYVRGDSPPMYELEKPFAGFEEYSAALKAHYRTNIKRAQRKFATAGCRFVRLTNLRDIRRVYTPEVHRLYEAVVMNSETRLEVLSHQFFLELARQLPGQLALTVAYREDRLIGFTWELVDGPVYHFLFMGVDYSQNIETDLYFNLVYQAMDHAFRSGASHSRRPDSGWIQEPARLFAATAAISMAGAWGRRSPGFCGRLPVCCFRLDRIWHPTTCSRQRWRRGARSNCALATDNDRDTASGFCIAHATFRRVSPNRAGPRAKPGLFHAWIAAASETLSRRHRPQRLARIPIGPGTGNVRERDPRQNLHVEDFFHARAELQVRGDRLRSANRRPTGHIATGRAGPRSALPPESAWLWRGRRRRIQREAPDRVQCPAVRPRIRSAPVDGIQRLQAAVSRVEKEELIADRPRRVRQGQAAGHGLSAGNFDEAAARRLRGPPAGRSIGFRQGRDITGLAVHQGQPIQMATVFGRKAETNGGRQRGAKL